MSSDMMRMMLGFAVFWSSPCAAMLRGERREASGRSKWAGRGLMAVAGWNTEDGGDPASRPV